MKIGDTVKSKNPTGAVQVSGRVIALFDPIYCGKFLSHNPDSTWKIKFPDWQSKPIVLVALEKPSRTATLEEWIASGALSGVSEEDCRKTYDENCPITDQMLFPMDDLSEEPEFKSDYFAEAQRRNPLYPGFN